MEKSLDSYEWYFILKSKNIYVSKVSSLYLHTYYTSTFLSDSLSFSIYLWFNNFYSFKNSLNKSLNIWFCYVINSFF